MNFVNKSFIIFFLILSVAGVFAFHWFFIDDMMPASECASSECAYSSAQILPPETMSALMVALMVILLVVVSSFLIWPDDKLERTSQRYFLKDRIDVFCYKLISWLKILEKRDPQTAIITARISDFGQ